jgi:glycerophosphoryl diester phosphodiesterase
MTTAIFAHRGSSFHHAEQSRESFLAAIEEGADGIECDVRLTADGVAFCWHDRDLSRLTGSHQPISKVTSSELKSMEILDPADPLLGKKERRGTPISLEELAGIASEAKMRLLVETKHPVLAGSAIEEEVARIIRRFKVEIHLLSFSFTAISRAMRLMPEFEHVQLLQHSQLIPLAQSEIIGLDIELIRRDQTLVPSLIAKGKRLFVYTVNDDDEFRSLANQGVEGIITDIPAQAKRVLGYP